MRLNIRLTIPENWKSTTTDNHRTRLTGLWKNIGLALGDDIARFRTRGIFCKIAEKAFKNLIKHA